MKYVVLARKSRAGLNPVFMPVLVLWLRAMPKVQLDEETVARLDSLRQDDESYDELIEELINIYEAEELTMFHGGDEI